MLKYWDNWQGWYNPGVYILTPGEDYTAEAYSIMRRKTVA
jgi:hypothetical protein